MQLSKLQNAWLYSSTQSFISSNIKRFTWGKKELYVTHPKIHQFIN